MTAHLMGTLARRGVEAAHEQITNPDPEKILNKLPGWGLALLSVTLILFVVLTSSLEYAIRLVQGHLAMVESSETIVEVHNYEPASKEDTKIAENLVASGLVEPEAFSEPELVVEKCTPLTSSIRRTKRHLMSIGGGKARWRGLGIFILYSISIGITGSAFRTLLHVVPFGGVIADVAAGLVAARLHAAWTHKVITMPSAKSLRERIVTHAQWKELVVPTIMSVAAHSISLEAVRIMFLVSVQAAQTLPEDKVSKWVICSIAVVPTLIGSAVLALFVMLPAYVSLVRKEASLLSPEEETIVPMDRTFGGSISHTGAKLNIVDAWNSFDWAARKRLVKLYVKFFFILMALVVAFSHILALEFLMAAGDDAKDIMKDLHEHVNL